MTNEPIYIILADDDEGDRLIFLEAIAELKMHTDVKAVNNGIQLMELLNKEDMRLPNFLFLDLNMPRKNGLCCLQEIRKTERLKDIFIAVYSTSGNEKDIEETTRHGADVYIIKPNSFSKLKEILHKTISTKILHHSKPATPQDSELVPPATDLLPDMQAR